MIILNELTNRQQIILSMLASSKQAITSSTIAKNLSVSSRTIKNEMEIIKEFLEANGANLVAKRNLGYYIEILDNTKYTAMKETLRSKNAHINVKNLAKSDLDIYLKRILISTDHFVTIDSLCQTFYLAKSTIQNLLNKAYPFFKSFNLEVLKSSQGIKISGPEYARRMAMTELVEINNTGYEPAMGTGNFEIWAGCSLKERQDIRHCFLSILRKSRYSVRDSISQRISMYLIIARNRHNAKHEIDILPVNASDIRNTDIYNLSKYIYDELSKSFSNFDMDENEILFLAVYLLSNLDLSSDSTIEVEHLNPEINKISCTIINKIEDDLGFKVFNDEKNIRLFTRILTPILISHHFGIDGASHYEFSFEKVYLTSPLMHYFSIVTCQNLNKEYSIKTSSLDEYLITCFYWSIYLNLDYPIKPLNILTTHSLATSFAYEQCQKIRRMFPEFVNSITAVEAYEIRELPEEQYDVVITENLIPQEKKQGLFGYNYDFPACQIKMVEEGCDFRMIYNNILTLAYQTHDFIPALHCHFYDDFIFISKLQIFQLFAERYTKDKKNVNAYCDYLRIHNQYNYNTNGNIICIFGSSRYTENDAFDLYTLNKTGKWNGFNINHIFYICLKDYNKLNIKTIHLVLKYLTCNPEMIIQFKEDPMASIEHILRLSVQI